MNNNNGFASYTSKNGDHFHFFFDSENESARAVKVPSPKLPGAHAGRIGDEIKASSEDDARTKLISAIESGDYI